MTTTSKQWKAESVQDLPQIAADIIPLINDKVIQVQGEMGVGKTTFIKEIIAQMGSTENVSSPTYSLVNEYETNAGIVYHFDFYRITGPEEAYDIGWEEYADSGNLCLIEWPERIADLIPEKSHILEIRKQNNDRIITFN